MKIYYKEDQNIEFMESWNSTELLKWICGFANAKGCKMYIGVRDDGEVIGLSNSKKLMEDIPNAIVSAFGNRTEAYIDELVSGILKNDIEKRYGIRYTASFERMAQHLMNIAPVKINSMDLSEEFGFKSSYTADNYVEYLERVYLLCMVSKHSYKSQIRVYNIKAYPVDIALMNRRKDAFAGENLG